MGRGGLAKHLGGGTSPALALAGMWCATTAAVVLLGWSLAAFDTAGDAIVYFVFYLCVLGLVYTTWHVFFKTHRRTFFGTACPALLAKVMALSLAAAIVLEGCTVFGDPGASVLHAGDWSALRMGAFFLISYTAALVFALARKSRPAPLRQRLRACSWRKVALNAAVLLAVLAACALAAKPAADLAGLSYSTTAYFCLVAGLALFSLFALRKSVALHPERLFLVVALGFGSCIAFCLPATTGLSWDDQIHYGKSLELSYVYQTKCSDADKALLNTQLPTDDWPARGDVMEATRDKTWSQAQAQKYSGQLDDLYATGKIVAAQPSNTENSLLSVATFSSLGYIPSATGLWLGRLLHLPFSLIFILGRFANLLAYCLVSYAAIRVIPVKKVLLCAVALVPTSVFLAAGYSYDAWMIAFFFLGVALAVKEFCQRDRKLTVPSLVLILAVFFAALGPKAIYFPLIGILFMMPRSKFRTSFHRRLYYGLIVAFGLLIVASFAIPLLTQGAASVSDPRGGSGVDADMQIRYILGNPLAFVSNLASYLFGTYLTPATSAQYTLNFVHIGNLAKLLPFTSMIPLAILLVVALTDCDSCSARLAKIARSAWMGVLFVLSVGFVALSLYISYTPVGSNIVNGCQHRYLLPLLFPLLALCFNVKYRNPLNRTAYNAAVLVVSSAPIVLCTWYLVIAKILP